MTDFVWADPVSYDLPPARCPVCGDIETVTAYLNGGKRSCACSTLTYCAPPHFPDPNADPIALLEAALVEKDEIIATQYREMTAWKTKLTEALAFVRVAHEQTDNMHARLQAALARVIELESDVGYTCPDCELNVIPCPR